jgi:hypothetical protein
MQAGDFSLDSSSFGLNAEDVDYSQQFDANLVDIDTQGIDTDGDGQPDNWIISSDLDGDGIPDEILPVEDINKDDDFCEFPSDINSEMCGVPDDDMEHWHQQAYPDTCAIASQEFILDSVTGVDFSEDELRQQAIDNGWYTPGGGTLLDCMGNLLEANGVDVDKEYGCTLEDLSNKLQGGQKVIVAIDADEIWYQGVDEDDYLSELNGMPGQGVNHAVQVIGIDNSDPNNPTVILNDPGTPDGQGSRIPADQFLDAWADSNSYMISTTGDVVTA